MMGWQDTMDLGSIGSGYFTESSHSPNSFFAENPLTSSAEFFLDASLGFSDPPNVSKQRGMSRDLHITPPSSVDHTFGSEEDHQSYFSASDFRNIAMEGSIGQLPSPPDIPMNFSNLTHDCTNLAFSILSNLYRLSACASDNSEGIANLPTIDQVLKTNNTAINNVITLLSCSCSRDLHFPILLAVISSKILAWYQAIARIHMPPSDVPIGSALFTETVTHTPIVIGAYKLDGEAEEMMKTQLVLSELRKMGKLVEKFIEKFCEGRDIVESNDVGVYLALGTFLKTRLRDAVEELERRTS